MKDWAWSMDGLASEIIAICDKFTESGVLDKKTDKILKNIAKQCDKIRDNVDKLYSSDMGRETITAIFDSESEEER